MGPLTDASTTSQRIREDNNVTLKRLRHSHLNNVIFSCLNMIPLGMRLVISRNDIR